MFGAAKALPYVFEHTVNTGVRKERIINRVDRVIMYFQLLAKFDSSGPFVLMWCLPKYAPINACSPLYYPIGKCGQ